MGHTCSDNKAANFTCGASIWSSFSVRAVFGSLHELILFVHYPLVFIVLLLFRSIIIIDESGGGGEEL
jgi:hypothetical protein